MHSEIKVKLENNVYIVGRDLVLLDPLNKGG